MARQIKEAHGDRYVHQPWTVLEGVKPAVEDIEEHLDGLIANAKKLLEGRLALHPQLRASTNSWATAATIWPSLVCISITGIRKNPCLTAARLSAMDQLEANGHHLPAGRCQVVPLDPFRR